MRIIAVSEQVEVIDLPGPGTEAGKTLAHLGRFHALSQSKGPISAHSPPRMISLAA
jgi:hypothetical protein